MPIDFEGLFLFIFRCKDVGPPIDFDYFFRFHVLKIISIIDYFWYALITPSIDYFFRPRFFFDILRKITIRQIRSWCNIIFQLR